MSVNLDDHEAPRGDEQNQEGALLVYTRNRYSAEEENVHSQASGSPVTCVRMEAIKGLPLVLPWKYQRKRRIEGLIETNGRQHVYATGIQSFGLLLEGSDIS